MTFVTKAEDWSLLRRYAVLLGQQFITTSVCQ